jgi:hypothetical protein
VHTNCREEEQLRVKGKKETGSTAEEGGEIGGKEPHGRSHGKNIGDDKNLGVCH